MRMPLTALVFLVLPLASAGPLDGSAEARSVADRDALDVLGTIQAWPEGHVVDFRYGPAFLPDGAGGYLAALSDPMGGGGCELLGTDALLQQRFRRNVAECDGSAGAAMLLSGHPQPIVMCRRQVHATAALLLSVDEDATTLWSVSAADLVDLAGQGGVTWSCNGGAWNGGTLVVVFTQDSATAGEGYPLRHAVVAFDGATGDILWQTALQNGDLVANLAGDGINIHEGEADPGFAPLTVTALGQGYVVTGLLGNACGLMLLHLDGAFQGMLYASETSLGRPRIPTEGTIVDRSAESLPNASCSGWAVPVGSFALMGFGTEVVRLDPTASGLIDRSAPGLPFRFEPHSALGPVVSGNQLAVPIQNGIVVVGRDDLGLHWAHRISPQALFAVWDVATTPSGGFWIVGADSQEASYAERLDSDGSVVQRLPLGLELPTQLGFDRNLLRIVPLADGFAVVDRTGKATLLGEAADGLKPRLSAIDLYPLPGEAVDLDVVGSPLGNTTVYWGDGLTVGVGSGGRASTFYETPGDRTIRATTLYADGKTATTALVVHVGGTPPQELTFLQQAFAPGRQDTTWGVIGIIVAFFGGIGAYSANHWRRRGVARQLRAIDGLRALAAAEPLDALDGLRAFRRELRRQAERGRIDGSQYASLLQEAERLGRAIEVRVWGVLQGRLGPVLRGAVEAALTDGHLSTQEHATLREALRRERRLSERERAAFGRLLDGWPAA